MTTEERLRSYEQGSLASGVLREPGADAALWLLPDTVEVEGDFVVAAFSETAQPLRVELEAKGISIKLATPPDARLAAYREHDATVILPIILAVPGAISGILQIADWIEARFRKADSPAPPVRYRQAEFRPDGTLDIREIEGAPDSVAALVRERARALGAADDPSPDQDKQATP